MAYESSYTGPQIDEAVGKVLQGTAVGPAGPPGPAGENGATFRPFVSDSGVLSWTNDKGLSNPEPVNIKGQDGTNGTPGAVGPAGPGVPAGGTAGQVLEKASGTDYDTRWVTPEQPTATGVSSFNGRTGAVTAQPGDYTAADVGARPDTWMPTAADVGAATQADINAAIQSAVLDSWEGSY